MVTTKEEVQCNDQWYLDSGCSSHMTGRKDWFVTINSPMKNKLKFTDDTNLVAKGVNGISIEIMDSKHSLIKNVFCIPVIKGNLLSIGKLLKIGYKIHMENKALCVMYANRFSILKAHMAPNLTFKVKLKVMEHRCLTISAYRE